MLRLGFLYISGAVVLVITLIAGQYGDEAEHLLAGLPHWAVSCPLNAAAVVVIGQSQASNTGPLRHISLSRSRAFANNKCYLLRDPMPGSGGRGGTIWPLVADRIGRQLVIADIAISGSAIEQWTTPEQQAIILGTLRDLRKAGFPKPLIIWMQGETNAARHSSTDAYYFQLQKLHNVAPDYPWLITNESICYNSQTKWAPLDEARKQLASKFKSVTIGPDLDKIGLVYRQMDQCHLTSKGQSILAHQMSVAIAPILKQKL